MTDAIKEVDLVIPGGNGSLALTFANASLGWSDVTQIMIVFPPGCAGLVGVQVQYATNPVYPGAAGSYFILDDYALTLPVSNQQQAGQWRMAGYNQDNYAHTIRTYFYYNYLASSAILSASSLVSL